jgi:hypothetical protein
MKFKKESAPVKKSSDMVKVELLLQMPIEDFLRHEYITYKLNTRQISEKIFKLTGLRFHYATITRWIRWCNIKLRKQCWE